MSKVVLNSVVLGQSGTASNNFLLDTDAAGALRIRRNADGSGGSVLTVNSAGTLVQPAQSMVRLNTGNGQGSTNTAIHRFTTVVTNQGSDITYADSATNGATFTVNTNGVYAISFSGACSAASYQGISLNTTQPTTNISTLTNASEVLAIAYSTATNNAVCVSWVGYLPSGSVVRAHGTPSTSLSTPVAQFTITRVA